ncbi:MAG: PEP-CTERM sorting domain-containing protein [Planctomycetota bacterium]
MEATGEPDPELSALAGLDLVIEYTIDPTTPDLDPDPTQGRYFDPLGTLSVTVGPNIYTSQGVSLVIEDTQQGDVYSISQIVSGNLFGGARQAAVGLTFLDPSGQAFLGDRLPLTPPSPAEFGSVGLALGFGPPADDDETISDDFDLLYTPAVGGPPSDDSDIDFDFIARDDDDPGTLRRFDSHSLRASQVLAVPEPATVLTAAVGLATAAAFLIRRRLTPGS